MKTHPGDEQKKKVLAEGGSASSPRLSKIIQILLQGSINVLCLIYWARSIEYTVLWNFYTSEKTFQDVQKQKDPDNIKAIHPLVFIVGCIHLFG